MAAKDVQLYYEQVAQQYLEMQAELKDFSAECERGLVSPEQVEQYKQMLQPIKTNYEMISYIIFLLNKPVRAKKFSTYKNQNKKLLTHVISKEAVLDSNNNVLKNLHEYTENLKNDCE